VVLDGRLTASSRPLHAVRPRRRPLPYSVGVVSALVRKIVNKHERDIRAMQRTLFTDAGERPAPSPGMTDAQAREYALTRAKTLPHLRGRSISNRRAEVSVLMDRGPAASMEPDANVDPSWSLITVSVKGINLLVGNSEILDPDEYTAWAQAVVGETWARHLYAAGAQSGHGDNRLTTHYFYVFTDHNGTPTDRPTSWQLPLEAIQP
jgi:hypothetical protein